MRKLADDSISRPEPPCTDRFGADGIHVADHVDAARFERLAGKRRDGERHALQAFFSAPCADDDLFERAVGAGGLVAPGSVRPTVPGAPS